MRVLVACERSGVVRDAFRVLGHDAWSCDIEAAEHGGPHIQGNVFDVLDDGWNLMVAHPPCRYLARSGLHWNARIPGRAELSDDALDFVRQLMCAPIPRQCIENPPGRIGSCIRPADQYIQPYMFGEDAAKLTGLWLRNLPKLHNTGPFVPGRIVHTRMRWANQTDSGQDRLGPSKDRSYLRARTYSGVARAMAAQWGSEEG